MVVDKNQIIKQEGKKPILYDVYHNGSKQPKPIIIFCHGYKGFKDWGAWHLVATAFANAGFFFLKFNFSHNGGTVQEPIDFPDLEAFARNTYSLELDDLERVITALESNKSYASEANLKNISLVGHSRGGGAVLIKAEENKKIKQVVTWAGVSDFKSRFQEGSESFNQWEKNGVYYVENTRTKQQMPHYFQFYKDYKANEHRFTIKRAVENLKIPQLIIHGGKDETVALAEAQQLHLWNPSSTLNIIKGGDHVFGTHHPWNKSELSFDLKKAVQASIEFLTK